MENTAEVLGKVVWLNGKAEVIIAKSGWLAVFIETRKGPMRIGGGEHIPQGFFEEMRRLAAKELRAIGERAKSIT